MTAPPAFDLADAEWLAHRYVEGDDAVRFIHLPRAEHDSQAFLIDSLLGPRQRSDDLPAAPLLAVPRGKLHFLFHSAFCGSTLLARALSVPGVAMGLSEPTILNDVVGFRRRGARPAAVARAADLALRLLGRPFAPGEAVIVKPSNLLNPLAELLLTLEDQAQALFLYAPLETFLISVARKGLHCRAWVRELLEGYVQERFIDLGFAPEDYFRLTDLQVAAVGWLAQHQHFTALAGKLGGRIASLDADVMTARPEAAVAAVAAHYGLVLDPAAVAAGPAFARNSKTGAAYSPEARTADYAAARGAYGEEIGMVMAWAEAVAANVGLSLAGPNPLPLQA
ncbi:MAG: hypothetical protein RL339_139 [Pseudomonadota bacterium]|jgi:hypothetical protein